MGCNIKVSPAVLSASKMFLALLTMTAFLTVTIGMLTSEMFQHAKNLGKSEKKWTEWRDTYIKNFTENRHVLDHAKLNKVADREFRFWKNFYEDQRDVFRVLYASIGLLGFSFLSVFISIAVQWVFDDAYAQHKSWYRRIDCAVLVLAFILALLGCIVLAFSDKTCSQYASIIERSQQYHEDLVEAIYTFRGDLPVFSRRNYTGFPHFPAGMTGLFQGKPGSGRLVIGYSITDAEKLENFCRQSFNRPILLVGAVFVSCILLKAFVFNIILMTYGLETTPDDDDDEDYDYDDSQAPPVTPVPIMTYREARPGSLNTPIRTSLKQPEEGATKQPDEAHGPTIDVDESPNDGASIIHYVNFNFW